MGNNNKIVYVSLLCAIFCFAWSIQDKIMVQIKPASVLELRQYAEKCSSETGVPAEHLRKIIDKTLPNDKPNKQFFKCVGLNSGIVDKDGHFMLEKMQSFNILNGTQEDYSSRIKECNKVTKGDDLETLVTVADCIHENYHFVALAPQ